MLQQRGVYHRGLNPLYDFTCSQIEVVVAVHEDAI